MESQSVVIVGGGLAATRTVAALRDAGHTGVITVVSQETEPPYDRPPLSKELLTREQPAWLSEELGIRVEALADHVLYGTTAQSIKPLTGNDDTTSHSPAHHSESAHRWAVTTHTGQTLTAAHCVIATGSTPLTPLGWENTHTLRTLSDANQVRTALTHVTTRAGSARVVIIGAGWIGLELAGHLTDHGHHVTVLESGPAPLWRQLSPNVGHKVGALHPSTTLHCDAAVTNVQAITGTTTTCVSYRHRGTDNTITADVVITAVGVHPATQWLTTSHDGSPTIMTRNDGLVTTTPTGTVHRHGKPFAGLYAVGDCAIRYDGTWGEIMPGHWNIALTDPQRIAHDMMGLPQPKPTTPHVFSTQGENHLDVFGVPHHDNEVVYRELGSASWLAAWLTPDAVATALMVVNSPRDTSAARRILRDGPVSIDPRAFTDPTIPLKNVVRAHNKGVSALAHRAETPLS